MLNTSRMMIKQIAVIWALLIPSIVWGIGNSSYVSGSAGKDKFVLSSLGTNAPLHISSTDYTGVIRAVKDLKSDIGKVTGHEPDILFDQQPLKKYVVIIGTLGKCETLDLLVRNKKVNVQDVVGGWETFLIQVVDKPFKGVDKALVIAGSDKRGTIYGVYDLCEQIGVSPWYWWSDVPVEHLDALFVDPGRIVQRPGVKYRGIFINDEAPALTNWVQENFGMVQPRKYPPVGHGVANYNHAFYARIFELLLRLKANYLWPAMWSNAFNEDDPENPRLADEYGIVMGTSHQEPMLRSQQEWDRRYYGSLGHWNYTLHRDTLEKFWRDGIQRNKGYESIITMGLRGANDSEMAGDLKSNIAMVEDIVNRQMQMIKEEMNADLTQVPQSWCLYKEILEYYNEGMRVPDHITLLWTDDNWGNIRRLPDPEERKRSGGAGVYYHFDYHGDPRSYEWINTNPIAKIWDQMSLAKQYGADRIWVVNVGHFKGYELPMEFFLSLAWNPDGWKHDQINAFTRMWASREFGSQYANEIADILSKYTKFNGRRKPESLSPQTYSLIHYMEAETVVSEYNQILNQAEKIFHQLPVNRQDAFYQTVLFPVKACAIVNELYVTAAKNQMYANQMRASTNDMARRTRELFRADTAWMNHYNFVFANGKWNHFMDQTHMGYIDWMPPRKNSLDAIELKEIMVPDSAMMGIGVEGSVLSWPGATQIAELPSFDPFNGRHHYFELFNRGSNPFEYHISSSVPWLKISEQNGVIGCQDKRIIVSLDSSGLPPGHSYGEIIVTGAGEKITIITRAFNPDPLALQTMKGFVESGGVISIEAEHFSRNLACGTREWIRVEDYGLTLSGMRATAPANAAPAVPGKDAPCLEYPLYFFSEDSVRITLVTSPLLNFMPDRDIRLAVSFDDQDPVYLVNVPDGFKVHWSNHLWAQTVVNQARHCTTWLRLPDTGSHTLKIWMIDPGVVVQKIMMDTGGLKPSYLGPKESVFK